MKRTQRGDTLVEVLIAITVLGIVVVGSLTLMNRSMVSIINSTERTAVRTDINSQINLINYVFRNASESGTRDNILSLAFRGGTGGSLPDLASGYNKNASTTCDLGLNEGGKFDTTGGGVKNAGSFYLDPHLDANGSVDSVKLVTGLTVTSNGPNTTERARPGSGLWVDAVYYEQSASNAQPYIDFYVKACWTPIGSNPNSRSLTVYRLYPSANTISLSGGMAGNFAKWLAAAAAAGGLAS